MSQCKGKNCKATDGIHHSEDCMLDYARSAYTNFELCEESRNLGYHHKQLSNDATENQEHSWEIGDQVRQNEEYAKARILAKLIWESTNKVDFDPLMSDFDSLDEPIASNLVILADALVKGSKSLFVDNLKFK